MWRNVIYDYGCLPNVLLLYDDTLLFTSVAVIIAFVDYAILPQVAMFIIM